MITKPRPEVLFSSVSLMFFSFLFPRFLSQRKKCFDESAVGVFSPTQRRWLLVGQRGTGLGSSCF